MKTKIGLASIVILLLSLNSAAFGAPLADNQVQSQHVAEADGTSGQDTNSGAGIKSGHIQQNAIVTDKIADGAVTDAKIGGTISQSKVNGLEAVLAGKSDVTHNHDNLYQQKYGKVAVVAQAGGDYADPVTAMNNLSAWCGTPSASNPCLLKIMPGIYDIGGSSLFMQPYVIIEGSGQNITKITAHPQSYSVVISPWGADGAEMRSITIENSNPVPVSGTRLTGIWIESDFTMEDVRIIVNGSTQYEVYNNAVMVTGAWYGPRTAVIKNSTIVDSLGHGIATEEQTVRIYNSDIMGGYRAVYAASGVAYVVNTKLEGGGSMFTPSSKCIGVYDGNYSPINCP